MIITDQDRFLKMLSTPQTCDFCEMENQRIAHIILHPIMNSKIEVIGYIPAKKCCQCIEEASKGAPACAQEKE